MTAPEGDDAGGTAPQIASRPAALADASEFMRLYRELETELTALKKVWPITEGLAEPVDETFTGLLTDRWSTVLIGTIDDVPVGFLVGRSEPLQPQAGSQRIAVVRHLFTEPAARETGVAEAMMGEFLADSRTSGHRLFDAHVSPGHRIAKNFYEANGFKARHIVMNRDERSESADRLGG